MGHVYSFSPYVMGASEFVHVLANPGIVYWSKDIYELNNKVLILNSTICLTILGTLTSISNKTSSVLVHNKFTNKHTTGRLLTKLH